MGYGLECCLGMLLVGIFEFSYLATVGCNKGVYDVNLSSKIMDMYLVGSLATST